MISDDRCNRDYGNGGIHRVRADDLATKLTKLEHGIADEQRV